MNTAILVIATFAMFAFIAPANSISESSLKRIKIFLICVLGILVVNAILN